jgi:hypothetical protein
MIRDPLLELRSARKVANLAHEHGVSVDQVASPTSCGHIGAILADSVLQAGLNYRSVVRPRVERIRNLYPYASTTEALVNIVSAGRVSEFLVWNHPVKIRRFESLVTAMDSLQVQDARELRTALEDEQFCSALQGLNGIGPKTVDYMACLVGIESVAVDRHIRSYAVKAGVERDEYQFLKRVFCSAADLLSVSRRGFDAWVWRRESERPAQMSLAI